MLGYKTRDFKLYPSLTLEELVPENHFVRKLEARLDLEFVRDLVRDCYLNFGRPSIDPSELLKDMME
jgi:transposase